SITRLATARASTSAAGRAGPPEASSSSLCGSIESVLLSVNGVARPAQHVVDPVPVYGEQQDVRVLRRLARRARPRISTGIARQALELLPAVRIAEDHLVSGAGEDCPELPAHQARPQDSDSHGRACCGSSARR